MRRSIVTALAAIAIGLVVALPATGDDGGPYLVRAIFDNGSFVVPDEDVRIAGARVGKVSSVDVSRDDEVVSAEDGGTAIPGKAVIVLQIDDDGFKDFREDASCIIRPQSLIGERYIDCTPTQPRAAGEDPPPELDRIEEGEPGEGQRLLPLENNGKSVDLDLIQNIQRAPYRDRFRLILNELGAGLAARGEDLGEVVDRANPALRQTNRVLAILASQSRNLGDLAENGDRVLEPLARNRTSITGFMRNAAVAGEAAAERRDDLELGLERFPRTLREVRLTMAELRNFADQGTPLFADIGASAPELSRATENLAPFARAAIPAFETLGDAAEKAGPKLVAADPVLVDLRQLGDQTVPATRDLAALLDTFSKTNGFRYLMDFIYYTVGSINGFDSYGHFLRSNLQITSCLDYEISPFSGCIANFAGGGAAARAAGEPAPQLDAARLEAAGDPGDELRPEIPLLDDVLPQLVPEVPAEENGAADDPGDGREGDGGDENAAGPDAEGAAAGEADPAKSARAKARRLRAAERARLAQMRDAGMLLDFLLGGRR